MVSTIVFPLVEELCHSLPQKMVGSYQSTKTKLPSFFCFLGIKISGFSDQSDAGSYWSQWTVDVSAWVGRISGDRLGPTGISVGCAMV